MKFEPFTLRLKANYLNTMGTVVIIIWAIFLAVIGAIVLGALTNSPGGALGGFVIGVILGGILGYARAFNMKLRGQLILLQLELEEHTRKTLNNMRLLNERIEPVLRKYTTSSGP